MFKLDISSPIYTHTDNYNLHNHPELLKELMVAGGLGDYYVKFNERFNERMQVKKIDPTQIYHNKLHSYQVALNCFEGGLYCKIPTSQLKVLLVAALYHDADHSYGATADSVNITNAIRALEEDNKSLPVKKQLYQEELEIAFKIIRKTHFPYKDKAGDNDLFKIIRDADLMSVLTEDKEWRLQLVKGLFNESNGFSDKNGLILFKEKQEAFVSKIVWNTPWARIKVFKHNLAQKNREVCSALLNVDGFINTLPKPSSASKYKAINI
jgi:hypothetical protein